MVASADVVGLARLAFVEDQVERLAAVLDEEPVALLPAVAVDRQRLVPQRVRREQRDELLDVLTRADVVRWPRDDDGQAICLDVGAALHLGAGFTRRVWAARVQGVRLLRCLVLRHVTVHFIGRHVQKSLYARLARRLKQHIGAVDIRLNESARLHERAVDVRLGGEVDDAGRPFHQLADERRVCDIALDEPISRIVGDIAQVVLVAGVGQLVQVDDVGVLPPSQQAENEVAADEAAAARDQVGTSHRASRCGCGRPG